MDSLTESLLWCIAQVTLVALLAWLMCAAIRRGMEPGSAIVPATALMAIVLLTACAFLPWPQWWRYGPRWQAKSASTTADSVAARDATPRHDQTHDLSSESSFTQSFDSELDSAPESSPNVNSLSPVPPSPALDAIAPDWTAQLWPWLPKLLAGGLACGVALGLLQLVGGLLTVRAQCRRSQPLNNAELLELVDCLRAELCLTRNVQLHESNDLATAATIGWKQPVILLPPSWREWTDDQRRAVLAHELAHVARGDYMACVLAQFSLAVHFYHPLVHWLAARLRLEQELAADATAVALSGGRRNYLNSLAELAPPHVGAIVGLAGPYFLADPRHVFEEN